MKPNGFTLIELMVTVAVLAIVISIGLPAFEDVVKDNRIQAEQRRLLGAINLARSEATHRNQVITISSNGGGAWGKGFKIYTDGDAAGNSAYSAGTDTLLKEISGSSSSDLKILSNGAGDNGYISFLGNGMLNEGAGDALLAICDDRGANKGRLITISRVGRATVSTATACDP